MGIATGWGDFQKNWHLGHLKNYAIFGVGSLKFCQKVYEDLQPEKVNVDSSLCPKFQIPIVLFL